MFVMDVLIKKDVDYVNTSIILKLFGKQYPLTEVNQEKGHMQTMMNSLDYQSF